MMIRTKKAVTRLLHSKIENSNYFLLQRSYASNNSRCPYFLSDWLGFCIIHCNHNQIYYLHHFFLVQDLDYLHLLVHFLATIGYKDLLHNFEDFVESLFVHLAYPHFMYHI